MTDPAAASQPVITLEAITRHYVMGEQLVRALDGVNLTIERGEFWAIMGPSGSGKSTMLNLLGCLDRPTTGRFLFEGEDVSGMDDTALSDIRLRRIGFIFQSFNLLPQLTVQENIELPLDYLGRAPETHHRRARALAEKVGLGERLEHRPVELSGGQQQRVAIARALANDPSCSPTNRPATSTPPPGRRS